MASIEHMAALNLIVCGACVWACICRLNTMSDAVPKRVRFQFVALLVGCLASGLQPMLFKEWPGVGQTVLAVCVLIGLVISMPRWRHGPPADLLNKG
jgi:hypothetical protein